MRDLVSGVTFASGAKTAIATDVIQTLLESLFHLVLGNMKFVGVSRDFDPVFFPWNDPTGENAMLFIRYIWPICEQTGGDSEIHSIDSYQENAYGLSSNTKTNPLTSTLLQKMGLR